MKNNIINSKKEKLYTKKSTEFMRKKSTINYNDLYEFKLKNVRKICTYFYILIYIV